MKKLLFIFIVAILSINAIATQKDYWEHDGSVVSFGCFTFQDVFVESYPLYYQSKYKVSHRKIDDFIENPGKYFSGSIKKYESNPYTSNINDYGNGVSIVNINKCLINKNGFTNNYTVRKYISKELCNKLAPNLNGTCKKAAYLGVNNLYGGTANRGFLYIYGQFEIKGKNYIIPLKRFNHYKDADRFIKSDKLDSKNIKLENDHNVLPLEVNYEQSGNKLHLYVSSINLLGNAKGGISISIPEFSTTKRIIYKNSEGFKSIGAYKKGKKIWNRELKKTVRNKYLLLEGWSNNWKTNKQKQINVTLDISGLSSLNLHVRSNIIKNKIEYTNPTKSNFYNQQGYYDEVLSIDFK